jgi:hypothetical protein
MLHAAYSDELSNLVVLWHHFAALFVHSNYL